jgi:hypothetical protein
VTIDWTMRENVRARLRVLVKRILRKYGYPPDKQEKATQTVLEQAALLSEAWATQAEGQDRKRQGLVRNATKAKAAWCAAHAAPKAESSSPTSGKHVAA